MQQLVQGEIDEHARVPIHEHMATCDDCRRLVADVARSLSTVEAGPAGERSFVGAGSLGLDLARKIGRYALVERIGEGGTGVIYRAHDPQLRRDIALKLLRPDRSNATGNGQARLLREAQAMARLAHPNVVSVHDAGIVDGQVFVAMELVEGQTLKQWLRSERRSVREVLDMFVATARGLEAAHAAGLVHRDFKPTNVLVGRDGRPRVTDFGLARAARSEVPASHRDSASATPVAPGPIEHTMTATGTLLGTPAYMAPEQFIGAATDARTDQFSFCVALHEGLFGERPFAGETLETIAVEVTVGRVRAAPRGAVPEPIAVALRRGLERDPNARFPSMGALIEALSVERVVPKASASGVRSGVAIALATILVSACAGLVAAALFFSQRTQPATLKTHLNPIAAAIPRTPSTPPSTPETVVDPPRVMPAARAEPVSEHHKLRQPTARSANSEKSAHPAAPDDPELIRDPWSPP